MDVMVYRMLPISYLILGLIKLKSIRMKSNSNNTMQPVNNIFKAFYKLSFSIINHLVISNKTLLNTMKKTYYNIFLLVSILFISNHGCSQCATDVPVSERQALIDFQLLEEGLTHRDDEVVSLSAFGGRKCNRSFHCSINSNKQHYENYI